MLTGDKGDTAKMIGILSGMLSLDHNSQPNINISETSGTIKTVLKQINEDSLTNVTEEFNKLDEILKSGHRLELMVSGLKLVKILY